MNSTIVKGLLFPLSLIAALVLCEILLRIVPNPTLAKSPTRFILWSDPSFETDSFGAVTLAKNNLIREVAIYDGKIEYDTTYKTNSLGAIDHFDYVENTDVLLPSQRRYIFVGDSFTAGSGGYAWVKDLRDQVLLSKKKASFYNFGVPGIGLPHFEKILKSVSLKLNFTDIFIVAITNDFQRHYWVPSKTNDIMSFCGINGYCRKIGLLMRRDASLPDMMHQIAHSDLRNQETSTSTRKKLHILQLMGKVRLQKPKKSNSESLSEIDFSPLQEIRLAFPQVNIYLIHLPEIDEVVIGSYRIDLEERITSMKVHYFPAFYKCNWSRHMFYEKDGHPNRSGYDNILNCIDQHFFQTSATK